MKRACCTFVGASEELKWQSHPASAPDVRKQQSRISRSIATDGHLETPKLDIVELRAAQPWSAATF